MVTDDDKQSVKIQYDHQEVLYGKEDEHLVYNVEVDYDSESDDQEGSVLDEEALHDAPDVPLQTGEQGATLAL